MEFDAVVKYSEYALAVMEGEQFSVEMLGFVNETDGDFVATEDVTLTAPSIYIVVRHRLRSSFLRKEYLCLLPESRYCAFGVPRCNRTLAELQTTTAPNL